MLSQNGTKTLQLRDALSPLRIHRTTTLAYTRANEGKTQFFSPILLLTKSQPYISYFSLVSDTIALPRELLSRRATMETRNRLFLNLIEAPEVQTFGANATCPYERGGLEGSSYNILDNRYRGCQSAFRISTDQTRFSSNICLVRKIRVRSNL